MRLCSIFSIYSDLLPLESKKKLLQNAASLDTFMYDKFRVQLQSAQVMIGRSAKGLLKKSQGLAEDDSAFLIPRTNFDFLIQSCILLKVANFTKFKVTGSLPSLQLNFSDEKYHALLRLFDIIFPSTVAPEKSDMLVNDSMESVLTNDIAKVLEQHSDEKTSKQSPNLKLITFEFEILQLKLSISHSEHNANLTEILPQGQIISAFALDNMVSVTVRPYDMSVDFTIGKISIIDELQVVILFEDALIFASLHNLNLDICLLPIALIPI